MDVEIVYKRKNSLGIYKQICSVYPCENFVRSYGKCQSHLGYRRLCKYEGCEKTAARGFCIEHGGIKLKCSVEGCEKYSINNHLCIKHGAIKKKRCSVKGCENQTQQNSICRKHGAPASVTACSVDGCKNNAKNKGLCSRHGTPEHKKQRREYEKKYSQRPEVRIKKNLRTRFKHCIDSNYSPGLIKKFIGCSLTELRHHLEEQWVDDMSWDNYGLYGWHIDHIIPCKSFDFNDPKQQAECFHYTNLQPLWATDNLSKGRKVE